MVWKPVTSHTACCGPPSWMAKGRKISPEVQQIIVRLSAILSKDDIAVNTGISPSAIKRILRYFEENDSIPADAEKGSEGHGYFVMKMLRYVYLYPIIFNQDLMICQRQVFIWNNSRDTRLTSGWNTGPPCSKSRYTCFSINNLAHFDSRWFYNEKGSVLVNLVFSFDICN